MQKTLPQSFFERPVVSVARDLVGCYLVRERRGKLERYMITETEAYDGEKDLACHASKGRTARTEIMYGDAAHLYIYFVYGMHWLMNIVTGPRGHAAAVLIRGIEGVSGPARLTKLLGIDGHFNKKKLGKKTGIWIEPRAADFNQRRIKRTPRIGVDYAGPIWKEKKWRFVVRS